MVGPLDQRFAPRVWNSRIDDLDIVRAALEPVHHIKTAEPVQEEVVDIARDVVFHAGSVIEYCAAFNVLAPDVVPEIKHLPPA